MRKANTPQPQSPTPPPEPNPSQPALPTPPPNRKPRTQTRERLDDFDTAFGRVYIERVNNSPNLTARTFIQGGYKSWTLKTRTVGKDARREAMQSFQELYDKSQTTHLHSRPFAECAEAFLEFADTKKKDLISDGHLLNYHQKWSVLKPYFENDEKKLHVKVHDVDADFLDKLRDDRCDAIIPITKKSAQPKKTSPATVKKDIDFVIQVMKHAKHRMKIDVEIPSRPEFRGKFAVIGKKAPALNEKEFNDLEAAAYEQAAVDVMDVNLRTLRQRRELYAFITIAVGGCMRPDETPRIKWGNCEETTWDGLPCIYIVLEQSKRARGKGENREKLEAWVLGPGVKGFKLLQQWTPNRKDDDYLFPREMQEQKTKRAAAGKRDRTPHAEGLKKLLKKLDLYVSKHPMTRGRTRSSRSFRATGMSMILNHAKNPNVDAIAKVMRTSPEQVRKWYDQNQQNAQAGTKAFTFEGADAALFAEMAAMPAPKSDWLTVDWYETNPDDEPKDFFERGLNSPD